MAYATYTLFCVNGVLFEKLKYVGDTSDPFGSVGVGVSALLSKKDQFWLSYEYTISCWLNSCGPGVPSPANKSPRIENVGSSFATPVALKYSHRQWPLP